MFERIGRVAAMIANVGKIGDHQAQLVAVDEILDDDEIERIPTQRCRAQPVKVENGQNCLRLPLREIS